MCMALPSRVLRTDGLLAVVDSGGSEREVSLVLMPDDVAVGDYVLVRNGRYACERVEPAQAREMLRLIDEVLATHDGHDLRRW